MIRTGHKLVIAIPILLYYSIDGLTVVSFSFGSLIHYLTLILYQPKSFYILIPSLEGSICHSFGDILGKNPSLSRD